MFMSLYYLQFLFDWLSVYLCEQWMICSPCVRYSCTLSQLNIYSNSRKTLCFSSIVLLMPLHLVKYHGWNCKLHIANLNYWLRSACAVMKNSTQDINTSDDDDNDMRSLQNSITIHPEAFPTNCIPYLPFSHFMDTVLKTWWCQTKGFDCLCSTFNIDKTKLEILRLSIQPGTRHGGKINTIAVATM